MTYRITTTYASGREEVKPFTSLKEAERHAVSVKLIPTVDKLVIEERKGPTSRVLKEWARDD